MNDALGRFRPLLLGALGVLPLVVLPWAVAVSMGVRPIILPTGSMLWQAAVSLVESNTIFKAAWISLWRVNVGFLAAVLTAVPLGILLRRSRILFMASR